MNTTAALHLQYVTFRHAQDNRPEPREAGWDELLTLLTEHCERPGKDGPAFSPAIYRAGAKRGNEGVLAITAAVADLDSGVDWEEQQARLAGLEWVAWSTHSYTPENGKCRVVLPLASPVPVAEWPDLFRRIDYHLFRGLIDQATKDPARLHYLASHEPGAPYFVKHQQGALLDPYSLVIAPGLPSATNGQVKHTGSIPQIGRDAAEFIAFGAKDGEQRSRALAVGRNLLAAGYTVEQVAEKLLQGFRNSPSDPGKGPWTEKDALQIAQSLADSTPTKPREIEGIDLYGAVATMAATGIRPAPDRSAALRISGTNGEVHLGEVEPPDPPAVTHDGATADLPEISVTNRPLRDITSDTMATLVAKNEPPTLFVRSGEMVRIRDDEQGRILIEPLTESSVRGAMARTANHFKVSKDRKSDRWVASHVPPPIDVVRDAMALGYWDVPPLAAVVEAPTLRPDGSILDVPGHDRATRLFYRPTPGLNVPTVPESPTAEDVDRAKALLLVEMIGEFPFVSPSDLANAVGLGLQPFVREMIAGPTPLHMIEAPMPGSGKGLLAEALLRPSCGRTVGIIAQAGDDDEWRKRLTAVLRDGHAAVQLDNVTRALDSGALSMALTAPSWTDRILGQTATIRLPIRCTWLATANNPSFSTELARRTIRIRLDPRVDRPWERTEWRHQALLAWVDEHRGELIWANLVLIRAWVAASQPDFSGRALGSYERWSNIIGGILDHAGIEGFLANADEFYEQSDTETTIWRAFVESWWTKHQGGEVGTAELFPLAVDTEGFDLGQGTSERAQKTAFGMALGKQRDRVVGGYRIVKVGERQRISKWRLLATRTSPNPTDRCTSVYLGVPSGTSPTRGRADTHTRPDAERYTEVHKVHPDQAAGSLTNPDQTQRRCACGKLTKKADHERCFDCRIANREVVDKRGWVYTEREQYEDPNPTLALPLETAKPAARQLVACQRCNDEFEPTPTRYSYCSDACRDEDIPE